MNWSPPLFCMTLGHLLNRFGETPTERGIDDLHQYFALPFLRPVLPDAVLEPIRLHVDAKRCLCAIDDDLFRPPVRGFGAQPGVARRHLQQAGSGGVPAASPTQKTRCACAAGTISPKKQTARRRISITIWTSWSG